MRRGERHTCEKVSLDVFFPLFVRFFAHPQQRSESRALGRKEALPEERSALGAKNGVVLRSTSWKTNMRRLRHIPGVKVFLGNHGFRADFPGNGFPWNKVSTARDEVTYIRVNVFQGNHLNSLSSPGIPFPQEYVAFVQ